MTRLFWARGNGLSRAYRDAPIAAGKAALRITGLRGSITAASTSNPPPTKFAGYGAYGSYKPDTNGVNCGVIAGSVLKRVDPPNGIYRPVAGETLENLDIYGYVKVNVSDVTIRNCRIRGIQNTQAVNRLVTAYDTYCRNLLIEDCTLVPDDPIGYIASSGLYTGYDGITGHHYTARRCYIANIIDGFGVFNTADPAGDTAVTIQGCYVGQHVFYYPTGAGDNTTHNDGNQIQGGANVVMTGNNFAGFIDPNHAVNVDKNIAAPNIYWPNNGLIVKADVGAITNFSITKNWYNGYNGLVNIVTTGPTGYFQDNRFGRDCKVAFLINPSSPVVVSGNVYDDNDQPVIRSKGA